MKKEEIEFEFGVGETLCCPLTGQIILDDDQSYLSDACLFYYYEPDFSWDTNNVKLESTWGEFLNILNTSDSTLLDKEPMAIELLINHLEKQYTSLLLLKITDGDDAITFCIDMGYKATK
jgi:hypothetical protein